MVASAKELAQRMAAIARLVRNTITRTFTDEDKGGALHQQMEGFRKVLLHDLTQDQFADMYAQTISYGLFAARCNVKGSEHFTRQHAAYNCRRRIRSCARCSGTSLGPTLMTELSGRLTIRRVA